MFTSPLLTLSVLLEVDRSCSVDLLALFTEEKKKVARSYGVGILAGAAWCIKKITNISSFSLKMFLQSLQCVSSVSCQALSRVCFMCTDEQYLFELE